MKTRARAGMRWLGALALCALAGASVGARASMWVSLVLSEPSSVHLQAAEALRGDLLQNATLVRGGVRVTQRMADEPAKEQPDLVVAIGVRAFGKVLAGAGDTPILALLVPRLSYAGALRQAGPNRHPTSALYLDQSYARQLRLAKNALPDIRRVGVILGPATAPLADVLEAAASGIVDLEIRHIEGPDGLFPVLDELTGRVDALLLVPDAAVVGRGTLPSLLLHTYRRRLPVIGYSESLTQAGALLSLYATPAQMGVEAARLIRDLAPPPIRFSAPSHPLQFSLSVNGGVARSLGIELPEEARLRAMASGEVGP